MVLGLVVNQPSWLVPESKSVCGLKKEITDEGLFRAEHKKSLPSLLKSIIIQAPPGLLAVTSNPFCPMLPHTHLSHSALVQGDRPLKT